MTLAQLPLSVIMVGYKFDAFDCEMVDIVHGAVKMVSDWFVLFCFMGRTVSC